jgi:hypothetical protein
MGIKGRGQSGIRRFRIKRLAKIVSTGFGESQVKPWGSPLGNGIDGPGYGAARYVEKKNPTREGQFSGGVSL